MLNFKIMNKKISLDNNNIKKCKEQYKGLL